MEKSRLLRKINKIYESLYIPPVVGVVGVVAMVVVVQSTISKLVNLITEFAPSSLNSSWEFSGIANSIIWLGVFGPASPINSPAKYTLTVPVVQQLPKSSFPHLEVL